MEWLGAKLGYKSPEDWYRLTFQDLIDNNGSSLVKLYDNSPSSLVISTLSSSSFTYLPWKFHHMKHNFWEEEENRKAYLLWVMQEVKVVSPSSLLPSHLKENHGDGLLRHYDSSMSKVIASVPSLAELLTPKSVMAMISREGEEGGERGGEGKEKRWESLESQRIFLRQLGTKLGFSLGDLSAWYQVRLSSPGG